MAVRRGEVEVFNLSFLDVISCGLGAVLTLFMISFLFARDYAPNKKRMDEALRKLQEALDKQRRKQEEIRGLQGQLAELEKDAEKNRERVVHLKRQINEKQELSFVGINTNKKRILLVVDLSGSMKSHLSLLRKVSSAVIEVLPDNDANFNILCFGLNCTGPADYLRMTAWRADKGFHPATPSNKSDAQQWLESAISREVGTGGTPTEPALLEAFSYPGLEAIILVTDGSPGEFRGTQYRIFGLQSEFNGVLSRVRERNGGRVEIHCVGLGAELYKESKFRDFLRALADENGPGSFAAF